MNDDQAQAVLTVTMWVFAILTFYSIGMLIWG